MFLHWRGCYIDGDFFDNRLTVLYLPHECSLVRKIFSLLCRVREFLDLFEAIYTPFIFHSRKKEEDPGRKGWTGIYGVRVGF